MGLDNGIIIIRSKKTAKIGLDNFFKAVVGEKIEICYWRKCWGLRNSIVSYLQEAYDKDSYDYILDKDDVFNIINIIKEWQNKKKWNTEGRSIWTYKEMKNNLFQSIENLTYLYAKMEDYDDIRVKFYDSY